MNFFTQLWQWLRPVAESAAEDAIERKLTNQPITAGNVVQDIVGQETAQLTSGQPAPNEPAATPAQAAQPPASQPNKS